MDKKELLRPNLARIMVDIIPQIHGLLVNHPNEPGTLKQDGTPVTTLDLALSVLIENTSKLNFSEVTIYSEENFSDWKFPLMAIDPLDGTREYIKGRPEWAISIGHFPSEKFNGEGWVYNPCTKELFNSNDRPTSHVDKNEYYGEVYHAEWDKGLYRSLSSDKFKISPMGSIAYKLGRLSAGKLDFVVSLAPKNIWDIAGGTLLCQRSKIKFYSQGKEVTEVREKYLPPLIWCREELFSGLSELFH